MPSGGVIACRPQQHPPLQVGRRARLLGPLRDRQDHVREGGGLREDHVTHGKEVQGLDALLDVRGVRRRHHRVGAHQQQGPDVRAERVEQLVGAAPRSGERVRVHAPHLGDMGPCRRVVQLAVAGQLVGLLTVFAPALTVALPGQAAVSAVRPPCPPGRQAQVDPRAHGVGALGLLLGPARGEHHRGLGLAEQPYGLPELGHRDAGDPLHVLRPVGHRGGPRVLPARRALTDVLLVDQPLGDDQVQQTERQREVRPRPGHQMQVGLFGGLGAAGVDDDQRAAVLPQFGEEPQGRRHGLGEVRADEDHTAGLRDVLQREGQPPVQAEGLHAARPPRTTCRSARCSRSARCRGRPARTCPACTPSRWSGRLRRRPRTRPGHAPIACGTAPRRSGPVPRPTWRARVCPRSAPTGRSGAPGTRAPRVPYGPCRTAPPGSPGSPRARSPRRSRPERGSGSCRTAGRSTGSAWASRSSACPSACFGRVTPMTAPCYAAKTATSRSPPGSGEAHTRPPEGRRRAVRKLPAM